MDDLGTGLDRILSHHVSPSLRTHAPRHPTTAYSRGHASFGRFLPFTSAPAVVQPEVRTSLNVCPAELERLLNSSNVDTVHPRTSRPLVY